MLAIAFLQNAWSPLYAGGKWPRPLWLPALHRSRSGRRLRVLESTCPAAEIHYDNTTPIVGATSGSVVPPDPRHIYRALRWNKYDVVLALGKQAEEALWYMSEVPMLILPHPACRNLTNELYRYAGHLLETGKVQEAWRTVLSQEKGFVRHRSF